MIMLFDIFSSFDPQQSLINSPIFLLTLLLASPIYISGIWLNQVVSFIISGPLGVGCQSQNSNTLNLNGLPSIYAIIFLIIIFLNWLSLIPYTFSMTSHILLTLSLALPSWTANILSSASYNLTTFITNFIPSGAPGWLNPALIVIEITSTVVRPLTLSFRLAANLSTGHVILTILGVYTTLSLISFAPILLVTTTIINIGYLIFEIGIAALQAYIFALLLTLYTDEHP